MTHEETLRKKTVDELREIAAMAGISVPKTIKKEDLINLIKSPDVPPENVGEPDKKTPEETKPEGKKRGRPKKNPSAEEKETKPEKNEAEEDKTQKDNAIAEKKSAKKAPAVTKTEGKKPEKPQEEQPTEEQPQEVQKQEEQPAETQDVKEPKAETEAEEDNTQIKYEAEGVLEDLTANGGFLHCEHDKRIFVKKDIIQRYKLKKGNKVSGICGPQKQNKKYDALYIALNVNGKKTAEAAEEKIAEEAAPVSATKKRAPETIIAHDEEKTSSKEPEEPENVKKGEEIKGILDVQDSAGKTSGFIRCKNYYSSEEDVYVPHNILDLWNLRAGDEVKGFCLPPKTPKDKRRLYEVTEINGEAPENFSERSQFDELTPVFPNEKYKLEKNKEEFATRIIDIFAPIGKGQRGLIVSPPKAGKTVLLKMIANSITQNYPDSHLIVLLIDERPEEVTDMTREVTDMTREAKGEVIASTFDELPERHVKVAELVYERARRLVEQGKDVVILLDSITRLARAYNMTVPPTGRSLSGGLDPGALYKPKKFFGAARNIEKGGSLTIVATALIDTGSKMDDVIFEEFKGTGNMELHLDRTLSEKRIFPAIDINRSGTRKEELLLTEKELDAEYRLRRRMSSLGTEKITTEVILKWLAKKVNNEEFINSVKIEPED